MGDIFAAFPQPLYHFLTLSCRHLFIIRPALSSSKEGIPIHTHIHTYVASPCVVRETLK